MKTSVGFVLLSFLVVGLGGLIVACQAPPTPADSGDPGLLFKDDFTQTSTGWNVYSGAEGSLGYDTGQYQITVASPGINLWGTPGLNLTDLRLEAEAAYAAGPANNEFGLLCRFSRSGDKSSFYFFLVSGDGYFATGKIIKNKRTYLDPKDFKASSLIKTDKLAVNHLAATCAGNKMSFAINDTPVAAFEDPDLTSGDFGLIAGALDEGGVKIRFDNVVARKP